MRKFLLITGLLWVMIACTTETESLNEKTEFTPLKLEMENVVQSSVMAYGELADSNDKLFVTIDDQLTWQNLLLQVHINQELQPIDFDASTLVAVFDQTRIFGGFSIDIVEIIEYEQQVLVSIGRLNEEVGGITQAPTRPYHIVKIPKIDKPFVYTEL
ncbi:protease complex subunit PrcB family protein [Flavobacterium sp. NKUCC04_CG]|uniref:protease complex subunit PrcB family protein n=1 Tax=Flavobacterium sp. NKUCC04_CG TaxID=2842121 RepID=UPI001C5AE5F1|nr:protease complex subunit PrcB family protein [Flavobacterium sp. NKUCC04_CG]MBW3520036.1 hypothetical protein [Flavobacterium sp. NKUCC04_CG]